MINQAMRQRWSYAFALQAHSDKQAYEIICRNPLSACHRLHQLQMLMEKLCKARLWITYPTNQGEPEFLHDHKVVGKTLPLLVKEHCRKHGGGLNSQQFREICAIAQEIDVLSPAVNLGKKRPDNSEYPWLALQDGVPVAIAPCQHSFRVAGRLSTRTGALLLKSAFAICEKLAQDARDAGLA
jgi:hypothetical protein